MKVKFLVTLVVLIFSACTQSEPDLASWYDQGVLIDTRTEEEFNRSFVPGARLVPYDQIAERIGALVPDQNTPILLYCQSGRRAGIAEARLLELGYQRVYNLGSIQDAAFFVSEQKQ